MSAEKRGRFDLDENVRLERCSTPMARSHEDIVRAREDWMTGTRFGEVQGYDGAPLPAPELPNAPLRPRGRVR